MFFLLSSALAAPPQVQEAWVALPTQAERDRAETLGAHFAEGIEGEYVRMHATPESWVAIQAEFSTLASPVGLVAQSVAGYRSPEQIETELAAMADSSPLVTLVHYGESVEGRPILGLEMGPETAPTWRITGAHHGDEAISSELAMEVAHALIDNQGAWAGLLEGLHITLIPVVNPDGLAQGSRYNANGVDLNRNYGFQWGDGTFRGPAPFSEPETRAVRTLALYRSHQAALSLHAGALNLGWPWNYTTTVSADEARMRALAQSYEDLCPDPDFYITNGAAWYVTSGDSNDWSLGQRGTLELTLEAWIEKAPPSAELDGVLALHLSAIADMLHSPVPLRVEVRDAESGQPLQATLGVGSRASDFFSGPNGVAWRMLETGIYTLQVTAPGYAPQELELRLPADERTEISVTLQRSNILDFQPQPALLPCCSGQWVSIPGLETQDLLTLSRPGHDPVALQPGPQGWWVEPAELSPGPWTLELPQGVLPNALLVGSQGGLVQLEEAKLSGDTLVVRAQGLGPGTRIFAMTGTTRGLVELEVFSESSTLVVAQAPQLDGTVDLLLLSKGEALAIMDLLGTPQLDPGTPADPVDTGVPAQALGPVYGYGGCSHGPGPLPLWGAWWLALALGLRRRPCL